MSALITIGGTFKPSLFILESNPDEPIVAEVRSGQSTVKVKLEDYHPMTLMGFNVTIVEAPFRLVRPEQWTEGEIFGLLVVRRTGHLKWPISGMHVEKDTILAAVTYCPIDPIALAGTEGIEIDRPSFVLFQQHQIMKSAGDREVFPDGLLIRDGQIRPISFVLPVEYPPYMELEVEEFTPQMMAE